MLKKISINKNKSERKKQSFPLSISCKEKYLSIKKFPMTLKKCENKKFGKCIDVLCTDSL